MRERWTYTCFMEQSLFPSEENILTCVPPSSDNPQHHITEDNIHNPTNVTIKKERKKSCVTMSATICLSLGAIFNHMTRLVTGKCFLCKLLLSSHSQLVTTDALAHRDSQSQNYNSIRVNILAHACMHACIKMFSRLIISCRFNLAFYTLGSTYNNLPTKSKSTLRNGPHNKM